MNFKIVWSWYSGTLAFLRHDPLFMYVQDSEQLFAQRKKTYQTSLVHEINNDDTNKRKQERKRVYHNMTTLINPRVLQVAQ